MRKHPIDREYATQRALQASLRNAGSLTEYAYAAADPSQGAKGPLGGTGAKWWQVEPKDAPGPGTADPRSTFLANNPFVWNRPAGCMGSGARLHPAEERARDHPTPAPGEYDVNPWAVGQKTFAEVSRRHPLAADVVEYRTVQRRIKTLRRKRRDLSNGKVGGTSALAVRLQLKELPALEERLAALAQTVTPERLRGAYRWKNLAEPWSTSYSRFAPAGNDSPGPQAYSTSKSATDIAQPSRGVKFSNIVRPTSPRCPPGLSLQSMHFHNGVPYAGTFTTPRVGPGAYLPDVYPETRKTKSPVAKPLTSGEHYRRQRAARRGDRQRAERDEELQRVRSLNSFDPGAYTRQKEAREAEERAAHVAALEAEKKRRLEDAEMRAGRRSVVLMDMPAEFGGGGGR